MCCKIKVGVAELRELPPKCRDARLVRPPII